MKIVSAQEVQQILSFEKLIPALKSAFSDDFGMPQRQMYSFPGGSEEKQNTFAVLPAWTQDVVGVKSFTHYPQNPEKGRLTVSAQVLLFSRDTGAPLALVDGTSLTYWRTAAISALASSLMSRENASTLLLFGTGELAPYMALAHASVRPITTIYISGRDLQKIHNTIESIKKVRPELCVLPYQKNEGEMIDVDIISCATGSSTPVFDGASVKQGTHIDLVGNHHPTCRECDSYSIETSYVIADSYLNVFNEAGEILIPMSEGKIEKTHVKGELAELCAGDVLGRLSLEQTTLFKSVGTALADVASAYHIYTQLMNEQDIN
ncbi:ornithine cyclodeaminase family protein [Psychromonas sp. KJ10-2]|uniref:ornithine cyclodeaminase family protein n=1 Tax=Psychromonas sp. KJ10-2 TaxID=3391822 RepID=UPI0039B5BA9C